MIDFNLLKKYFDPIEHRGAYRVLERLEIYRPKSLLIEITYKFPISKTLYNYAYCRVTDFLSEKEKFQDPLKIKNLSVLLNNLITNFPKTFANIPRQI